MLAPLAHHLCTSFIPLYRHLTHRTLLDVLLQAIPWKGIGHLTSILLAGQTSMPAGGTQAAELLDTGGAGHSHSLVLATSADVADGVAA